MEREQRKIEESSVETFHVVRPNHLNGTGRLFGGILLQWIDEVAGLVAKRHSRASVTTACIDNLKFMKGAYQNDTVVVRGKLTYVGNTSMEVRVDTYCENMIGERRAINRAYFTMVALDENDKPTQVPGLILETEVQKIEWENAEKRRKMRVLRKAEGI